MYSSSLPKALKISNFLKSLFSKAGQEPLLELCYYEFLLVLCNRLWAEIPPEGVSRFKMAGVTMSIKALLVFTCM